ncbi:MAG: hypothetical protein V4598_05915 [Bdellovibrionota bacterium]
MPLIDQLVTAHNKRPWWKDYLRLGWFAGLILWYLALAVLGRGVEFHSLYLLSGLVMALSVTAFSYYCSLNYFHIPRFLPALSLVFLVAGFFMDKSFASGRGFTPQEADFSCFMHACLYSMGPVLLFPAIDRQFFVTEKRLHNMSILLTLAFAGVMMIEMKCTNVDLEHILLGHMTPILGIGCMGMAALIFWKRFRVTPSSRDGGTL